MTVSILCSFFITFSLCLVVVKEPLVIGLFLLLLTLVGCLVSAMLMSAWYAYILFLVYVGGMLVMFAYVTALIPNVLFSRCKKVMYLISLFPVGVFMFIFFNKSKDITYLESSSNKFLKYYGVELASSGGISMMIGLGIILLINLLVVVKICYKGGAALRSFSY